MGIFEVSFTDNCPAQGIERWNLPFLPFYPRSWRRFIVPQVFSFLGSINNFSLHVLSFCVQYISHTRYCRMYAQQRKPAVCAEIILWFNNSPSMCDCQNEGRCHCLTRWSKRDPIPPSNFLGPALTFLPHPHPTHTPTRILNDNTFINTARSIHLFS